LLYSVLILSFYFDLTCSLVFFFFPFPGLLFNLTFIPTVSRSPTLSFPSGYPRIIISIRVY
jgi:hypothetical protein